MQQQNCICGNGKVARKKYVEKHEIFQFTVYGFHCLNFDKTTRSPRIHLSSSSGISSQLSGGDWEKWKSS